MTNTSTRANRAVTALVAAAGALVAVWMFASAPADGGDFGLRLDVSPSLHGGVTVNAAPLGSLSADSFVGPARVVIEVGDLRPDVAGEALDEALAGDTPEVLQSDPADVFVSGISSGLARLAATALAAAMVGGALSALLLRRRWTAAVAGAGVGAGVVLLLAAVAFATHDPNAYRSPSATGAFAAQPVVGDPQPGLLADPDVGSMLAKLQRNMVGLYNGFLLPVATATAREGATPVVLAAEHTDPALLSAVAGSTGAETALWLSAGPTGPGGPLLPTELPAIPELDVDRVVGYQDLPVRVGSATFRRHPNGSVTLAGPGAMSLFVATDRASVRAPDGVPVVVLAVPPEGEEPESEEEEEVLEQAGPDEVLVVYLDPESGALRAYDLVVAEGEDLELTRRNASGTR